jgi:3-dehydrosphinganine reductase
MLVEILFSIEALIIGVIYFIVRTNKRTKIDLRGKHVVITGGSQGIGKSLAIEAVKEGANVTIIARNKVG